MIDEDTPGTLRNDLDGHGTHVAGIIGAVGNQTTPTGMVGVNWGVTIVPMQVATITGSIDSNACIRAINYARDTWNSENRISKGDKDYDVLVKVIKDAVKEVVHRGKLIRFSNQEIRTLEEINNEINR